MDEANEPRSRCPTIANIAVFGAAASPGPGFDKASREGIKRSMTARRRFPPGSAAEARPDFGRASTHQRLRGASRGRSPWPGRCWLLSPARRIFERTATRQRRRDESRPGCSWPRRSRPRPPARCRSMPLAQSPWAVRRHRRGPASSPAGGRRRGCANSAGQGRGCARAAGERPASSCPSWSAPLLPAVRILQWRFTSHQSPVTGHRLSSVECWSGGLSCSDAPAFPVRRC
jgi:hypothetical protein